MAPAPTLILASASPRRLALLRQVGIEPADIVAPAVDEMPHKNEVPRTYALRIAKAKAEAVARPDVLVLAADTVVALGRRILPKADDDATVAQCLRALSGRRHMVMTAVALKSPNAKLRTRIVVTRVSFRRLTDADIEAYVKSGEGIGKAGGYAIQGRAEMFARAINGSYSNVVGLPLSETCAMLGVLGG